MGCTLFGSLKIKQEPIIHNSNSSLINLRAHMLFSTPLKTLSLTSVIKLSLSIQGVSLQLLERFAMKLIKLNTTTWFLRSYPNSTRLVRGSSPQTTWIVFTEILLSLISSVSISSRPLKSSFLLFWHSIKSLKNPTARKKSQRMLLTSRFWRSRKSRATGKGSQRLPITSF